MSIRRWRFEGKVLLNFRDMGGYLCDGGRLAYGKLYRSDQLSGIGATNIERLKTMGLKHVIDLRSEEEHERLPNDFLLDDAVGVYPFKTDWAHEKDVMTDLVSTCQGHDYIKRLEGSRDSFYPDLITLIAQTEGMTVFHCAAGKDRTGIVAALIQMLLGVDPMDIIADYQVSDTYLSPTVQEIMDECPHLPAYKFRSDAMNMELLMAHLMTHYGGAKGYLTQRGMSPDVVDTLRRKMVVAL